MILFHLFLTFFLKIDSFLSTYQGCNSRAWLAGMRRQKQERKRKRTARPAASIFVGGTAMVVRSGGGGTEIHRFRILDGSSGSREPLIGVERRKTKILLKGLHGWIKRTEKSIPSLGTSRIRRSIGQNCMKSTRTCGRWQAVGKQKKFKEHASIPEVLSARAKQGPTFWSTHNLMLITLILLSFPSCSTPPVNQL